MSWDVGIRIAKEEIPEAFADFFKSKVNNITTECQVDNDVYNGMRINDYKLKRVQFKSLSL